MNVTTDGQTINLDIEQAMQQGNLTVHYQPIFDIQEPTPMLVQAEALIRWDHPELGLFSPSDLNIWEASDPIAMHLTDYALQRVAEQHFVWERENIHLPVSVNLSGAMLNDSKFPERLTKLLAEHHVDHQLLYLEVGEPRPAILSNLALGILARLRHDGYHTVLDNFACNTIFLRELTQISWAGLKIDAGLIRDFDEDENVRRLVRGIIHLAHDLNMPAYALSVETPQSASILRKLGCDKAQGWFYGEAMSASDLTKLLMGQCGTADHGQALEKA